MVGDRRLTDAEKRIFIAERTLEFDGLATLRDIWLQKGEPTLHDLAIMELLARFEAWLEFNKEYAARVDALMTLYQELRVKEKDLEERVKALEERTPRVKDLEKRG
ncbi:hypothetical protein LCGC14_0497310 [marine sediment metagenome]|uniref:Uncharacterized protein n=1 Tax=marine sediment metagenome TaxID=412755 RepID=A0A0F9VDJ7_9ZZZZ